MYKYKTYEALAEVNHVYERMIELKSKESVRIRTIANSYVEASKKLKDEEIKGNRIFKLITELENLIYLLECQIIDAMRFIDKNKKQIKELEDERYEEHRLINIDSL